MMMHRSMLSFFGIKFNPFATDVPAEALYLAPPIEAFRRRIESSIHDGGFAMITGEPGSGKSAILRLIAHWLAAQRDVIVASIDHPQSKPLDFYRELGDLFGVKLAPHNRFGGFKALRARWTDHIGACHLRPILIIDEAQQMPDSVFSELRILASKDFDSQCLLSIIFAGDARLCDRFRHPDMIPLGTRIRRRLVLDYAQREDLLAALTHVITCAGNTALVSSELKETLVDHAAGNYRVMMNSASELLSAAFDRQKSTLDEKLFLEVFAPPVRKTLSKKGK